MRRKGPESVSGMHCLLADFVWERKVELNGDLADAYFPFSNDQKGSKDLNWDRTSSSEGSRRLKRDEKKWYTRFAHLC